MASVEQFLAITNDAWAEALWDFSGADGIIQYRIQPASKRTSSDRPAISPQERRAIRSCFDWIDQITGLQFLETKKRASSDIDFSKVSTFSNKKTYGQTRKREGWYEIAWRDIGGKNLTRYEQLVIAHEIGHATGLEHPHGDGYNQEFSTADTVMSFNYTAVSPPWYTALDQQALTWVWSAIKSPLPG